MRLIRCYIESFGGIKNKSFSFTEGFNRIVGENGSGKTTLSVFIKAMLYGLSDTKRTSIEENERKHYLPWDGSRAAGSLEIAVKNKSYRIERSFGAKAAEDSFALYDLSTKRRSEDYSENIGREIFGIDADGFERTVFLSERNLSLPGKNQTVSAKLGGLVGCDGDIEGMDGALKTLEDERKRYSKKGGGGEIFDIKSGISEIDLRLGELAGAEEAITLKEEEIRSKKALLSKCAEETEVLEKEREKIILLRGDLRMQKRRSELIESERRLTNSLREFDALYPEGLPSYEEINDISYKMAEAKGAMQEGEESPQLLKLKRKFENITDSEITTASAALERIEQGRKRDASEESLEFGRTYSKRIPEIGEVDAIIYSRPKKGSSKLALLLGAISLVVGVAVGVVIPYAFAVAAVGAILILTDLFTRAKGKGLEREFYILVKNYFESVGELSPKKEEAYSALIRSQELLLRKNELSIPDESVDMGLILSVISKLPERKYDDPVRELYEILTEYKEYSSLSVLLKYGGLGGEAKKRRAEMLSSEISSFMSKYGTAQGLDGLRNAIRKREGLLQSIESVRRELRLTESEDISVGKTAALSEEQIEEQRRLLREKVGQLNKDILLAEKSLDGYGAMLSEKEELTERRQELLERLSESEERLKIILLTKEMLTRAKDSMTARYIGKTKSGFEDYARLIARDEDGVFEMDTSFEVSRLEGGRAKSSENYSKGTRELFSLCARLALIDSLYEGEYPPIMLDDPFAYFDDERTKSALGLLRELGKRRQIIYFTCSGAR